MAINSRSKGQRGERQWRDKLRELLGIAARRGTNLTGQADVVADASTIHWEVKHREKLNIHDAIGQAVNDCGERVPAVAHKRNRSAWLITIRADDVVEFAKDVLRCKETDDRG